MKRGYIIFLLILIPLTSAVPTITFQQNETFAGETLFGTIESPNGFAKEISSGNIKFFEGRKELFIEHDVLFHDGLYYFYAYTNKVGNFSMKISNVLYNEEGIIKEFNTETPLSITSGAFFSEELNKTIKQVLSIKPGFFFSVNVPSIRLTNKGDVDLNVTFNKEVISLRPFETKALEFNQQDVFSFANFSTYKDFAVPIVYLSAEGNNYAAPDNPLLKANPAVVFANIVLGEKNEQIIQLFNLAEENITNITTSSSFEFLDFESFEEIPARAVYNMSLEITPDRDGFIGGELNISYTQFNETHLLEIPISLYVLPKGSSEEDFTNLPETCESAGGQICPDSCEGSAKFTGDGEYCCFGTCVSLVEESSDEGGSSAWIWGIVILLVLGGVGFWIYKRKKKAQLPTADDKLTESVDRYSKRISGGLER